MEVHEAIQFRSILHLPMNTYKRMQRIMTNFGYDKHFFPSHHRITLEQQKMTPHISKDTFVTEKMYLNISADKSQQVSVMYVKDLKQYIHSIVKNLDLQGKLQYDNFDGNIWLLFAGDKGGKHMKFHFEIINCKDSGSVYNVHIFAMYEGADSRQNMAKVLRKFSRDIEELQRESFSLCGHKVKIFLGGDYHFLDDCLGHQGSSATYPSAKDLVTLDHLRKHPGMAHTPENCPIVERTMEDLEASYNEMLTDDRAGGDCHKTGKFHESIIHAAIFPIKTLSQVVTPVLHIRLGTVLKLYQILLSKTQQKDKPGTNTARIEQEQKWEKTSADLLQLEVELVDTGSVFIDFQNLIDRLKAVSSEDWQTLDDIAKGSDNSTKKKLNTELGKCESVVCCVTKYDVNISWVMCTKCQSWVHYLCEGIPPDTSFGDDAVYECLSCKSFIPETLEGYFVAKLQENRDRQFQLETQILAKKSECEAQKELIAAYIGDRERQLLETLDSIKVVRQAYHGNVFIGNHCKIILNNYEKLCSVVSDEPEFHEHISESFRIYSELDKLISAKRFLTEVEILSVKELCTGFGKFTVNFPNETVTRKMHELIFDVPRFLAKHKTLGYLSEEEGESLHCSINKQLRQYQSIRNEGEKLVHVVKNQELLNTADRNLAKVTPRPKCDSCNIYLRKGVCPQCQKK